MFSHSPPSCWLLGPSIPTILDKSGKFEQKKTYMYEGVLIPVLKLQRFRAFDVAKIKKAVPKSLTGKSVLPRLRDTIRSQLQII